MAQRDPSAIVLLLLEAVFSKRVCVYVCAHLQKDYMSLGNRYMCI